MKKRPSHIAKPVTAMEAERLEEIASFEELSERVRPGTVRRLVEKGLVKISGREYWPRTNRLRRAGTCSVTKAGKTWLAERKGEI